MSNIRIETWVLGAVSTNCYLVYNEDSKEAVVVDPAGNYPFISNKCRELGVTPSAVLLTHGHFDHMLAAPEIRRAFQLKIYASETEDAMLADPGLNLSERFQGMPLGFHADEFVTDGQELTFLGVTWKVLETPGHTAGSVCYYIPEERLLLAGDTLFRESYGRTDFPTGSSSQMVHSILDRLFVLPDDTTVYPGHGELTSIGYEKQCNPMAFYR
ncbi:MAG: MBL fold metallo-hydrolase [Clostridiaceae bacterium]|uniref:MBL fold metallo-hydrolase n=1 Tax=Clostridium porci TaxID=2605778 RepID=A0A7X2NM09_9CLOT|nr:MBL fold metallo-hydrolase [Clostridium porci]MDY3232371.1 MBL fold metallo-hydrolase [Clostridiaceae bacterium]MSS37190.1 MBL fold metallo-hydrolase [Clostridium porci]